MKRDEAVDMLMKRLGNSTDLTLRDDIIREMVFVQELILEEDTFHPWFLVSEESQSATRIGDERVLLPEDFVTLWEYGVLYRYDATAEDPYIELHREDWDLIVENYAYTDKPLYYDIAGNYLLLRPLSTEEFPLRFWYIKQEPTLAGTYGDANNIENDWLKYAADWFLGEVGIIIASQYLQMTDERVRVFAAQAQRGRTRVYNRHVEQEEVLKKQVMEK